MIKNLVVALAVVIGLGACSPDKVGVAEKLTLANDTITSVTNATNIALEQGVISVRTACYEAVYGRMAGAMIDQAWVSVVEGDNDTAESRLETARDMVNGLNTAAVELAKEECN